MIDSLQNKKVKRWNKLKRKKERMKNGSFLIEGEHLIEEALHSDWQIKEMIIKEGYTSKVRTAEDIPIIEVNEKVFSELTNTETPQGVMAEVEIKQSQIPEEAKKLVLFDAVQDPGNLGTMIRTADAFGFDGIVLGKGCVDLFNDKVIRSTQGSLFHLPILFEDLPSKIDALKGDGFSIWVTALRDAISIEEQAVPDRVAVILGNEGNGVQEELLHQADQKVYIPIKGQAESLNVSIAAGIMMYKIQL
ncbi:RNA methyltransferase, TrmH family [Salinibacillus kushneri]|uniref:RNA methyltransferase, TrmH family n=2 Tax=Salinibacillus kushneri TaxID=237682 RepID=A0A1I0H445_9BACI|nr:RNA methyltransferase [Salinibacillus kushneri]SET78361.1 RNA methyltransferase, TrmH family [Salinibacillus kushneri]